MAGKEGSKSEGTEARRPAWRGRQDRDHDADDDDRDEVSRKHHQYRVTCVDQVETKTGHHRIVRLGVEEGGRVRQLDVGEVFRMIGRGDRFYVLRGGHKAYLIRNPGPDGEPHVETRADDTEADNLRSLPACSPEPAGILRIWPLLVGLVVLLAGLLWLSTYAARITWPPLASIIYGTPLGDTQLNAVANVSGRFDYTPASGKVLDAGPQQLLTALFTPQPWLLGGVGPIELVLLLALIILAIILGRTHAWRRFTRYEILRWGSLALVVLVGVFFILRGASAQNRLDVTPAPITLQFGPLADKVFGDPDFPVAAAITPQVDGIGVTFAATAGPCSMAGAATVHITGVGACTVTATGSSKSTNYGPSVNVPASFNIAKGPNELDFPQPPDRKLEDGDFTVSATASSKLPVTFTPGDARICTVKDTTVHPLAVGDCAITAQQNGNDLYKAADSVTRVVKITTTPLAITWANPADIYVGTPLSATQLNATWTPSGGAAVYDPPIGTTLPVGNNQPLKVTVTGAGPGKDLTGTKTVFINVLPKQPVTEIVNAEFLKNGGFEEGFTTYGPGTTVGNYWTAFNNGGEKVEFGYYDDTWTPVVSEGKHAQEIEIGTDIPPFRWPDSTPNRYSGIYQTVTGLIPGKTYTLTLHGRIRTLEGDPNTDNWSYIAEWAIDPTGGKDHAALPPADWRLIAAWQHVTYYKTGGGLVPFTTQITAQSETATLFVRLFKKPGSGYSELNLDLDGLSLYGPKYVIVTP